MEIKSEEYTLSNEDIKFPTFFNEALEESFKKDKITKESLLQDISKVLDNLDIILNKISEMILQNINNFVSICTSYKLNSYDYLIISQLIKELISAIKFKIENNNKDKFKIPSVDDFFKNEQYQDVIKNQYKNADINHEAIIKKINDYINDLKTILDSSHECGILFMAYLFKYYNTILIKIQKQMDLFYQLKMVKSDIDSATYHKNMIIFFDLISLFRIISTTNLLLSNSYFIDKNDLYNYEEDSEEWNRMKKIIYRVHAKNKDEIEKLSINNHKNIENMTIFFNKAINFDSYLITNALKAAGYYLKFKLNSDEHLMEFESKESSLLNPDKILFLDFLKLGNNKLFKTFMLKSYQKIQVREKIYMKKEYPEISLEFIKNLLIKIYGKEIIEKNFGNTKQKERFVLDKNKLKNIPIWAQKVPKEYKPYYVSTRLLNSFQFKNFGMKDYQSSFFGLFQKKIEKKEIEKVKGLIIFIHGGGFLNVKNFFSEVFLREICNNVNIPLLGFDFASAPEHPYPEGLNDCFQVYMWILNHCEKELGFKPEKIILSGDSSGGNYMLALTFLIISLNLDEGKNIRVPDLLLPLYPACHTGVKNMSLSLASSFEDFLLNINSLLFINKAYRGYYPNDLDPFLNPSEVTEDILKHLPKTTFITATKDPLRDDIIRLIRKISKIPDLDVKDYELINYQHGFMGDKDYKVSGLPKKLFCDEVKKFLGK